MRLESQNLLKAVRAIGFKMTRQGAMAAVRLGTISLNLVFVFMDVKSLLNEIKGEHASVKAIQQLIDPIDPTANRKTSRR